MDVKWIALQLVHINIYVLLNFGNDPYSIKDIIPMCTFPMCSPINPVPIAHVPP